MEKGPFYESMVKLYLRLNGYFQTGLISHSNVWGNNLTEIDSIAIRFPYHQQPERQVGFCTALNPSAVDIEVVIVEVKSSKVEFNPSLKSARNEADKNWEQILNWIGLFETNEIQRLIPLLKSVADTDKSNLTGIKSYLSGTNISIRPIIFSIENAISNSTPKTHISGEEVIDYIWECICPNIRRVDSSTVYPLGNWGLEFEPIVRYFKYRNETNRTKPTIANLTNDFSLT